MTAVFNRYDIAIQRAGKYSSAALDFLMALRNEAGLSSNINNELGLLEGLLHRAVEQHEEAQTEFVAAYCERYEVAAS